MEGGKAAPISDRCNCQGATCRRTTDGDRRAGKAPLPVLEILYPRHSLLRVADHFAEEVGERGAAKLARPRAVQIAIVDALLVRRVPESLRTLLLLLLLLWRLERLARRRDGCRVARWLGCLWSAAHRRDRRIRMRCRGCNEGRKVWVRFGCLEASRDRPGVVVFALGEIDRLWLTVGFDVVWS